MDLPERLMMDPEILSGKPVIRGSRIAAEFIIDLLAAGMPESEILITIPGLNTQISWPACHTPANSHMNGKHFRCPPEQCDYF
jgi:hypothetical protein